MNNAVRPSRTYSFFLSVIATLAMVLGVVVPVAATPVQPAAAADPEFKLLVFYKTVTFTHSAIDEANTAIQALGAANNFTVDLTLDANVFNSSNAATLAEYDAVLFNSTTGDVLNADQEATFQAYIEGGGGFAGLHAASDTEHGWNWYKQELVGGEFTNHPANQTATLKIEDTSNASTEHLAGDTWSRFDEWYNFTGLQRDKIHVLLSLNESTYTGGSMGNDHPISWCRETDTIRSWYTGLGHTEASYTEPNFLNHLLGGIKIAAGAVPSGCAASQSSSYDFVTLDDNTNSPMALDVAPDGTVFYAERDGRLRQIDPATNLISTAITLPVTQANEDGLLGVVLDPDFATNGWIYLYWAPSNVGGDGPHNRISRFTYDFGTKTASLASEAAVLKITTQRNTCCHAGGDMEFDNAGNLILATGDNTNPFESDGYNPIDERSGRQDYDAQRSSANTNDLRGKVLRITPTAAGGYTIPAGNLFDESGPNGAQTRPEIYAMGFRNPFRIGVDPETNNIIVGDYGPDAGSDSATRGPRGSVEWNLLTQPGNYGWPYCHGRGGPNNNGCYFDYNFQNNTSGSAFSPTAPVNNSPNNTGMTTLPPVINPTVWYPNSNNTVTAEIGAGGGAPMGGPVYRYDESLDSDRKWPEYWDGKGFLGEWNQGKMYSIQLDKASSSQVVDINAILPGIFDPGSGAGNFKRPMDFQFGPDGAMYVIDWGSSFNGNNVDSGVYRVDYTQGAISPIARAAADVTSSAAAPLTVNFSSEGSRHPFDYPITYSWNFGDGSAVSTDENPSHTYLTNGSFTAQLTVTDSLGGSAVANVVIVVGNQAPTLSIDFPENGGFFEWGDQIRYEVTVTDPDASAAIDCNAVTVIGGLGHDTHNHDYGETHGCEGWLQTARDAGHGLEANLFWVVNANYVDDGGAASVPLTAYATNVLNPTVLQAEYFKTTGQVGNPSGTGVSLQSTSDTLGGGSNLTSLDVNDFWSHNPVNLVGIDDLDIRLASAAGGTIEARWGSSTGPVIGTLNYTATGGAQTYAYQTMSLDLTGISGTQPLFFVNTAGTASVNYYVFNGDGVESNEAPTATLVVSATEGIAPLTVNAELEDVIDPDGGAGAPVTIEWDSGAGYEVGTATKSFSFTEPDTYVIRVRLTDAGGAVRELEQTIEVEAPEVGLCFAGRSDGFDGDQLDTDRWDNNVRVNQNLVVSDGVLSIPAEVGDLYQNSSPLTPNLVLQEMPDGAFTMDTKVNIPARIGYQQAGLLIYTDDNNYMKLTVQARSGNTTPDAAGRVIQMAKEDDAVASETNTAGLGAGFPDTVYLRLVSDGTTVTGYYSADGETYTQMAATRTMAGIDGNPRIGLFAAASTSSQAGSSPTVVADFDWFRVTPDDTALPPSPDDTFEGTALDPCRWTVVNEDTSLYRVLSGNLEIDTTATDFYGDSATTVPNIVLQPAPAGDWTMETKVDASTFDRQYQNAGLIVYTDEANYLKWDIVATNSAGSTIARNLELRSEIGNVVQNPQPNGTAPASGVVYLRLTKTGSTYGAAYSSDGVTWTTLATSGTPVAITNAALADARIGLYALGNTAQGAVNRTAKFDYFEVTVSEDLSVSATTSPVAPDGTNSWFKQDVSVTLQTAGGDPAKLDYREYNLDGAGFVEYTAPVVLSAEGTHTLEYRASELDGGVTAVSSLTVKIDKTAPTATPTLVVDPGNPALRKLNVASADATSGIAGVQYAIDGGEWQSYAGQVSLTTAAQTIQVRATDGAGNVSASSILEVPETVGCGVVGADDPFDGTALSQCRWSVTNEAPAGYRVVDGVLQIDTTAADIYGAGGNIPNVVLQPQPAGDWTIETKVDTSAFDRRYQNAGLIVYVDGDNYLKFDVVTTNAAGGTISRNFEFRSEIAGTVQSPQNNVSATSTGGIAYLRIAKVGGVYTASYSTDGTTWTTFTNTFTNAALTNAKVGLYALGSTQADHVSKTATFDYFDVLDSIAVSATQAPASANGSNGWYTTEVTTTVGVIGGSPSVADTIEYNLDGAGWTAYTAPVTVTADGEHVLEYRASEGGGTPATGSTSFKIDSTVPTATPSLVVDPEDATDRSLAIATADAGSGVALTEYRIDSGAWTPFTAPVSLTMAAQSIQVRATDAAGNVSTATLLEVPEVVEVTVESTVSPTTPNGEAGWWTSDVTVTASGSSTVAGAVTVQYKIGDGAYAPLTGPIVVSTEGTTVITLKAIDSEDNESAEVTQTVKLDKTAPSVDAVLGSGRAVTITGSDSASGVALIEYRLSGSAPDAWVAYTAPIVVGNAAEVVTYRATDAAGLVSGVRTLDVPEVTDPGIEVDRVFGDSRYTTAVEISKKAYPGTAPIVYIGTGLNYPDALAGGPAAAFDGGPLLLVAPDSVPAAVAAEIARLAPAKIVVIGGTPSVSEAAYAQLSGMAAEIERISGPDRYATSRALVESVFGESGAPLVYVATGQIFPDALSAGAPAGASGAPIVLVNGSAGSLDQATADLLESLGTTEIKVLGGTGTVSEGVFADLGEIATATRFAGNSRYETARLINADAFESADRVFLATGLNFPDALAGSAWAGSIDAPLYVVPGTCISQDLRDDIDDLGATRVTLLGGLPSLSLPVESLAVCP